MRIELLPSSIPVTDSQFLVTFLVNQEIAIDGGSIGLLADLHRQERIKHVFITHEHLDHIATLPLFLENIYQPGPDCVEVLATADVLKFLHNDIFNGRVWPDFFQLSQPENGFMNTAVLEPMQPVQRAGLTITPVVVAHGVETLGLVVDDGVSAVAFPSDTAPTKQIWEYLSSLKHLRAVFLEASFPASHAALAAATGHLCTTTFSTEIKKLSADVRWIVVHRKARYAEQIASEIAAFGLTNVEFVQPGFAYEF